MKHLSKTKAWWNVVAVCLNISLCTAVTQAQGWPEVFDPDQLLTLNLELNPSDWATVVGDETLSIEVPTWFWANGEESQKIYVSVRRKSGDPLPGGGHTKISLKIDINEYVKGQDWHGLNKLSLENGDDNNVVSECISINMHQLAAGLNGYGHDPGHASWVKLYVNGEYYGVYVNAEHLNKRFLINRGLYVKHATWLYQFHGEQNYTLETGNDLDPRSPAVNELCYVPFPHNNSSSTLYPDGGICPVPNDATVVADLNRLINMQSMLTMAAMNIFVANPDSLFSNSHNSHFLDFSTADGRKRLYFPWDLDSAMSGKGAKSSIYPMTHEYPTLLFKETTFKSQYDQIMIDLLTGPLSEENIHAFIDSVETPAF